MFRDPVCPNCGSAAGAQPFCGSCGVNLSAEPRLPSRAEWEGWQTAAEQHQRTAEQYQRAVAERKQKQRERSERIRRWMLHTRQGVAVLATAAVLLVAGGVLAIVVLPVGPDVSAGDLQDSVKLAYTRSPDAPPAADQSPIKRLECKRKNILSNKRWRCTLEADIAALPDATVTYNVKVGDNRCWTATPDIEESDVPFQNQSAVFIDFTLDGCLHWRAQGTTLMPMDDQSVAVDCAGGPQSIAPERTVTWVGPPGPFLTPSLPTGYFLLFTSDGFADARLHSDQVTLVDAASNTWVAVPEAGTPRWFRVVRQEGERIWTEDGTGTLHEIRVVPDAGPPSP